MSKPTWWRFRARDRASGWGSWDYALADSVEWATAYAEQAHSDDMQSDGWRGLGVEPVDIPPVEWLNEKATRLEARREDLCRELAMTQETLKAHPAYPKTINEAAILVAADLRERHWYTASGVGIRNGRETIFTYATSAPYHLALEAYGYPVHTVVTEAPVPAPNP